MPATPSSCVWGVSEVEAPAVGTHKVVEAARSIDPHLPIVLVDSLCSSFWRCERLPNLSRKQFGLSEVHRRSLLKQPALSAGHRHLYDYPTPSHLNVLWGFGSLGGIGLHVQIVTGIVLAVLLFDPRFGFGGDYAGVDTRAGWPASVGALPRYVHAHRHPRCVVSLGLSSLSRPFHPFWNGMASDWLDRRCVSDGWRCSSCRRECIPGSILLNDIHRLL